MPFQRARGWWQALQLWCHQAGHDVALAVSAAAKRLPGATRMLCDGAVWLPGHGRGRSRPAALGGGPPPAGGAAAAPAPALYSHGDVVVIQGLLGAAELHLNGRLAQVMRPVRPADPHETGTWCVRLEPCDPEGAWLRLRPARLRAALAATPAHGPCQGADAIGRLAHMSPMRDVLRGLGAEALCALRACGRRCLRLDHEMGSAAWRTACERQWGSKSSRFHLTDERSAELARAFPGASWRQLYHSHMSAAREPFGPRHLTELSWGFNFTREAGGVGLMTAQIVRFEDKSESMGCSVLHMRGFQPLPCRLHGSVLQIANFAPHIIRRLPSWEWQIANSNVIFLSGPLLPVELSVDDTIRSLHLFPDSCLLGIPEDGP
ncbi:unnamed protein product [Prorocentrum cordatum]|uniref:Uncharacterized protein n=1 Tax=Prorocentrum cordatum TaxID=2364126 RepID=A0ABN9SYF8_9DINO|nr:unnamed protein product [Polarella glacialis]